jgi:ATP-dependent Clp protease ATP-binding subunit ClpA
MEDALKARVVGQDEAIAAVSQAVRRARAGLQDPNRPIGSLQAITLRNNKTGKEWTAQTSWLFLCLGGAPQTQ